MDLNISTTALDSRVIGTQAVGNSAAPAPVAAAGAKSNTQASDKASAQTLQQAVGSLQESMDIKHQGLDFSVDEETGIQVVKVVARDSGEVIRQLPSEVVLKLAQSLKDGNTSLFDDWA